MTSGPRDVRARVCVLLFPQSPRPEVISQLGTKQFPHSISSSIAFCLNPPVWWIFYPILLSWVIWGIIQKVSAGCFILFIKLFIFGNKFAGCAPLVYILNRFGDSKGNVFFYFSKALLRSTMLQYHSTNFSFLLPNFFLKWKNWSYLQTVFDAVSHTPDIMKHYNANTIGLEACQTRLRETRARMYISLYLFTRWRCLGGLNGGAVGGR